jgi:hypothetical protein
LNAGRISKSTFANFPALITDKSSVLSIDLRVWDYVLLYFFCNIRYHHKDETP